MGFIQEFTTQTRANNRGAVQMATAHQQPRHQTQRIDMKQFVILQWSKGDLISSADCPPSALLVPHNNKGMGAADIVTSCQVVANAHAASHGCIMCSVTCLAVSKCVWHVHGLSAARCTARTSDPSVASRQVDAPNFTSTQTLSWDDDDLNICRRTRPSVQSMFFFSASHNLCQLRHDKTVTGGLEG
jgi:hypothetical protein